MSGFIDSIAASLSSTSQRLEVISQNIANLSTPGYKRQTGFAEIVAPKTPEDTPEPRLSVHSDPTQGPLLDTGDPLDLAISGSGYFSLRDGEDVVYGRGGQFRLADDGTVVNAQGLALQADGGGDLVLDGREVEILGDGTVLSEGYPVARIALVRPGEDARVEALSGSIVRIAEGEAEPAGDARLRQGMVEGSNVALADEMVGMMAAVRQAESHARMVQVWDQLSGRAINAFAPGGMR